MKPEFEKMRERKNLEKYKDETMESIKSKKSDQKYEKNV